MFVSIVAKQHEICTFERCYLREQVAEAKVLATEDLFLYACTEKNAKVRLVISKISRTRGSAGGNIQDP